MDVLNLNLTPCCHISFSYIMGFDIKLIHQRTQTTRLHTSCCHHCHYYDYYYLDLVLFHNITCYIDSLLSHIHDTTTNPPYYHTHFDCHKHDIREVTVYRYSLKTTLHNALFFNHVNSKLGLYIIL